MKLLREVLALAAIEAGSWPERLARVLQSGVPVNAGPWSVTNPPLRDGGYTNWRAIAQPTIQPTLAGIVCIPFTHDWGPFQTPVLSQSWADWQSVFGSDDTPGSRAVKQAFIGEGLPGYGGAGAVLSYRFGGSSALAASLALSNATPTPSLTLTAKYKGTRANRLNVTVRTNAADDTKQDLLLLDGSTVLEPYTFVSAPDDNTPIADLAALINLESGFVNATVTHDGTTLANVVGSALAGGNDGATLLAGTWTDMLTAVQGERFAFFAPFDLTDSSIQASITAWIQQLNGAGKRVDAWCGGVAGESAVTAVARAQAINDPNINTVGVGSVVDYGVVGTPIAPVILSTSQLAPRLAGIHAARGAAKAISFGRLAGCDLRVVTPSGVVSGVGVTDLDAVACIKNGVVCITRDSNPVSPLRIEKGVTTWQSSNTDLDRPYAIYKNPRFVKIMQDFEMAITEFAEQKAITPGLPLTQSTKEFVLGFAQDLLGKMILAGLLQPGASVGPDGSIPVSPTDDFLALAYQWYFTRELAQIRNTVTVG